MNGVISLHKTGKRLEVYRERTGKKHKKEQVMCDKQD